MRRNFANKRKYQNADPIGAESIAISAGQAAAGAVQDIPIADVNIDTPQLNITDSYTPTFEDLSFSAQQDPYMRQYFGITEGTTYRPPSGIQPTGTPKASTIDDAPVNMRQRILNRRSNRLDEKIANASAGEESVMDKARGALESLGIYNVSDAGKYMQAFTDSPERAFTRAGYNMELGPRGKARAAGNIAEASTSLLGSFLQGFGSYKKPEVMTEEAYLAAKKAEQDKKNNTVMIGDTRYTLVEDSEGRMTIGPEYQETETMEMGGRMGPKVIKNQDFYTRLDEATKGVNQSGTRNTATRSGVGEQYSLDLSTVFQSPQDLVDYYGMSSLTSDPKSTYYVNPERAKRMYELVTGSGKINPAELHMIMQARGLDSEGYENLTNAQVMDAINKVNEHMPGTYQAGPQGGFSGEQNLAAVQTALDHYGGVRRAYGVPFTPGQTAEERFSELYYEDYMASNPTKEKYNPNTPEGNIVKLDGGMGGVIRMQDFDLLNPTMYNPFAIQGQPANPVNIQDTTGNNNQLLTGVQPVTGIQSNLLTGNFMTGFRDFGNFNTPNFGLSGNLYQDYLKQTNPLLYNQKFGGPLAGFESNMGSGGTGSSSTVDITTDSDGDGIPDYQDDFDNSTVSEEERQKDINKAQASLFGTAAALGSSVGGNDLGVQAARAGMMAKRIVEGDNPLASTVGLLSGAASTGFGAARTMKKARSEAIASAYARKRAAEKLRQGIVTGGTKGRMELANEPNLQASTGDPMATESGQEGLMIGYSNGGVAQGEQIPPPPKGAVVGPLTARYFNRTAPVSPNGLVEYPNQMVNVPTTGTITMVEAEAGGELPDLVAAYPDGDPSIVMEKGKRYSFPNSTQVLEIPLNQALYG